jgi:hypothetical protein
MRGEARGQQGCFSGEHEADQHRGLTEGERAGDQVEPTAELLAEVLEIAQHHR